jgi:hypothetical protein
VISRSQLRAIPTWSGPSRVWIALITRADLPAAYPGKRHSHQLPDSLGLGRPRLRLLRDPSFDLRVQVRVEAQAHVRADARARPSDLLFFVSGYCTAPAFSVSERRTGRGSHLATGSTHERLAGRRTCPLATINRRAARC